MCRDAKCIARGGTRGPPAREGDLAMLQESNSSTALQPPPGHSSMTSACKGAGVAGVWRQCDVGWHCRVAGSNSGWNATPRNGTPLTPAAQPHLIQGGPGLGLGAILGIFQRHRLLGKGDVAGALHEAAQGARVVSVQVGSAAVALQQSGGARHTSGWVGSGRGGRAAHAGHKDRVGLHWQLLRVGV
jgi:hypothetical protein